jgi:hypothetical protein
LYSYPERRTWPHGWREADVIVVEPLRIVVEFRRRIDALVYRFEPATPRGGRPSWKRIDLDLWLVRIPANGWCAVDALDIVNGRPWHIELAKKVSG